MPRKEITRREDTRALRTQQLSQVRLRVPHVSFLECSVGERKQTSTARKASELSSEKEQGLRSWSEECTAGLPGLPPQRQDRELFVFMRFLPAVLERFDLTGSIDFRTCFLIRVLFFCYSPVTPKRARPVWLFLRWSVVFSKIVWREPTGSENAQICISLKCGAIFELQIEKKNFKLQVIKCREAHQRWLVLRHMVNCFAIELGG